MRHLFSTAVVGLALVGLAGPTLAQTELVVNGGFESGTGSTPDDWVVTSTDCFGPGRQSNVGIDAQGNLTPSEGFFFGHVGDQNPGGATCSIHQDVTLPATGTSVLTFDASVVFGIGAGAGESITFAVTTTGGSPLVTPFTRVPGDSNLNPMAGFGPVDLTPYAGQTVRLILSLESDGENLGAAIDEVSVVNTPPEPIPTLTEWAMILLTLLLAGAGAAVLQTRRARA